MRTVRLGAFGIQIKRVLANDETAILGNLRLPAFDLSIVEFLDPAAVDTDQVIMVLSGAQLEDRLARFEIVALNQPCLFELGQDTIDGGQADVQILGEQQSVDILGGEMADLGLLEQGEDLEAWNGGFQPHVLEVVGVAHRLTLIGYERRVSVMIYPAMAAVRHCRQAFVRIEHDPAPGGVASLALARTDHTPRSDLNMIFPRFALPVMVLCTLAACSTVPRIVNEYRIDVQQGNVLSQEMVSQLRPGLTKDQVRFILGTPVLTDMFHANRWDYFYWLKKGNSGEIETRRFTVFFDADGKLRNVAGDVAPVQSTDAAVVFEARNREIDLGSLPADGSTVLPPPDGPGFFGTIMESMGF